MNLSEEKWTIQQPQVTPSPHHQHPSMSSNGMSPENFIQPFSPYEGQTTQGQIHSQPIFVSMPSASPITPRQNGTPINGGGAVRKRRADTMGFPQDAGPFFSQTTQHYNLYSMDRTISYKLRINSKVDRGFFLADNDWTCYRRNYFQISSAFSISTSTHTINETEIPCLLEVDGQFHGVTGFLLGITARVSNSDKKIELVQHTPKRDKGPQMVPVPKPIRAGGNLNLSSVGSNSNIVTFERIQFKTATANNGKRRAAQQYYVVMVDLYAQIENGEQIRVASSTSAPLVVRGRSPGHYADNHERYNPISMNPAFPNDRHHIGFSPHPQGPNGTAPTMMPPEFNGSPFPTGPYGQYPPFHGFSPVAAAAGGIMMGPNGQPTAVPATPPQPPHPHQAPPPGFHPQQQQQQQHHHHHHQQYMVSGITSDSGDQQQSQQQQNNPEMYNNNTSIQSMDPHHPHHHQGQHGTSMEMHMEGVTPTSTTSPNSTPQSAFTSFESRPISTPSQTPTTTANTNNTTTNNNSNSTTSNTNNNNNNNNNNGDNNSKPFMKIEIPQSVNTNSSSTMEHDALTSPAAYHSQEYVDGFHLYHNNNNPTHEYHSDTEQHHHHQQQIAQQQQQHLQQQQVVQQNHHNSNGVNNNNNNNNNNIIDNNNDKTTSTSAAAAGGAIAISSSTHINNHSSTTPTTTNIQLPQQSPSLQHQLLPLPPPQINGDNNNNNNNNNTNSNDKLSSDNVPKSPSSEPSPTLSPTPLPPSPVTTDTNTSVMTTTKAPSSSTPTITTTTTATTAAATTNNNNKSNNNNRQRNE